eukprot:2288297-Pyramimonas_sp.AAC.1
MGPVVVAVVTAAAAVVVVVVVDAVVIIVTYGAHGAYRAHWPERVGSMEYGAHWSPMGPMGSREYE